MIYLLAADAILMLHALIVVFIVCGLVLILIGKLAAWRWVRNFWFRLLHLGAIAFVVIQSWLGQSCPLTLWEMQLRAAAGDSVYHGAFIAHWVQSVLYYEAPTWLFTLLYTLFGSLVLYSWYWVKPRR